MKALYSKKLEKLCKEFDYIEDSALKTRVLTCIICTCVNIINYKLITNLMQTNNKVIEQSLKDIEETRSELKQKQRELRAFKIDLSLPLDVQETSARLNKIAYSINETILENTLLSIEANKFSSKMNRKNCLEINKIMDNSCSNYDAYSFQQRLEDFAFESIAMVDITNLYGIAKFIMEQLRKEQNDLDAYQRVIGKYDDLTQKQIMSAIIMRNIWSNTVGDKTISVPIEESIKDITQAIINFDLSMIFNPGFATSE